MADRQGSMLRVDRARPVVLAFIAAVSVASCGSTPTQSTSPASQAVGQPTDAPAASAVAATAASTPVTTPTPRPAWHAYTTKGPIGLLTVAPDGTVYLALVSVTGTATVVAVDQSGQVEPGWPYQTGDKNIWGIDLAPDGTVYVVSGGLSNNSPGHLVALGTDGQAKPGWPTPLKSMPYALQFVADGTAYFSGTTAADDHVYALDTSGHPTPGWPVTVSGMNGADFELSPDGTVYVATSQFTTTSASSRIYAYGPDGKPRPDWPPSRDDLQSPTLAPDGTLYLTSIYTASRSLLAYGPDGTPKPGWHAVALPGPPFGTTVAPDGTIYVVVLGGRSGPDQVLALAPTGSLKPGWHPYLAPHGMYLFFPPVVGSSGGVYITLSVAKAGGASSPGPTVALGPDGQPLSAWPRNLVDTRGGPPTFAPDGTVYVVNGLEVSAFAPDGTPKPGWPYRLSGPYLYAGVTVGPEGTVYVVGTGKSESIVVALTPAGTPVGAQ